MLAGRPISTSARLMAATASLSETFSARLNESVVAGNCPWCGSEMGVIPCVKCVKVDKGTSVPLGVCT
jgi:hypothetical protein